MGFPFLRFSHCSLIVRACILDSRKLPGFISNFITNARKRKYDLTGKKSAAAAVFLGYVLGTRTHFAGLLYTVQSVRVPTATPPRSRLFMASDSSDFRRTATDRARCGNGVHFHASAPLLFSDCKNCEKRFTPSGNLQSFGVALLVAFPHAHAYREHPIKPTKPGHPTPARNGFADAAGIPDFFIFSFQIMPRRFGYVDTRIRPYIAGGAYPTRTHFVPALCGGCYQRISFNFRLILA